MPIASGAPVVMRDTTSTSALPWKLLGVHSSRMDIGSRDLVEDESLGLNCAWYADILMTLTAPVAAPAQPPLAEATLQPVTPSEQTQTAVLDAMPSAASAPP